MTDVQFWWVRCVEVKPSTSSCRARRSSSLLLQMIRNLPRELFSGCRGWLIDIAGCITPFQGWGPGFQDRFTTNWTTNQKDLEFFHSENGMLNYSFTTGCCGMPDFHRKSMAAPDHSIPSQNSLFSFNSLYDLIPYEDLTHINMAIHRAAPPAEPSSLKIFRDSLKRAESRGNLGNSPRVRPLFSAISFQERRLLWWTIPGRGTQQCGHHQADGQGSRSGSSGSRCSPWKNSLGYPNRQSLGWFFSWGCHGYIEWYYRMISQNTHIKV